MKSRISKISAFVMALLVLLSTVSLTVEKHFCGDFLVDIAYFGDTDGCSDVLNKASCDSPEKIEKDNCCKNEVEKIEGQDNLKQETSKKITLEKQQILIAFINSFNHLFTNLSKQIIAHKNYSPPELFRNIQITYQVFIL